MSLEIYAVFSELLSHGWLKEVQHFDEIDSTNLAARRFAAVEPLAKLPALFVADRQTQGRGRGAHVWWSPRGCLMLTLAVSSQQLPQSRETWSRLALVAGVGAAAAIERACPGLEIQLKWPNDLYVAGRKLGGILIEAFPVNSDVANSDEAPIATLSNAQQLSNQSKSEAHSNEAVFAIGIGINVDIDWNSAPPDVATKATCLSSASENTVSTGDVLNELIVALASQISVWSSDQRSWFEAWHPRCLLTGKIVTIDGSTTSSESKQRLVGRCEGVAIDGRLLIRTEVGRIVPVSVGEVLNWHS